MAFWHGWWGVVIQTMRGEDVLLGSTNIPDDGMLWVCSGPGGGWPAVLCSVIAQSHEKIV